MTKLSRTKWCLLGSLLVMLALVAGPIFVPDKLTDAVKWVANNDFARKLRELSQPEVVGEDTRIEMVVESIGISKIGYQPVVILRDKGGELYLPIWIGLVEANAISVILEGVEVPRPLTPDLLCSIIDRTGVSVDYIVINDLQYQTFYAKITLDYNWRQIEIDSRPSDAIAIALRTKVPIYVTKAVLEKAGVPAERKTDEYTTMLLEKG